MNIRSIDLRIPSTEQKQYRAESVDVWYNPHIRLWEVSYMDHEGNLMETEYVYGKKAAMKLHNEMLAAIS